MKLQHATSCALLLMACLTGQKGVTTSRELEEKTGFPQQCIFNVARKLKRAGYINTIQGPFGGYALGKSAKMIALQEILILFKDPFSISCDIISAKKDDDVIALRNVAKIFMELESDNMQKMSAVTLADLLV